MAVLYLGSYDKGKRPKNRKDFLRPYHIDGLLINKVSFRDDDRTKWRSFREGTDDAIFKLQQFLFKAGFMPRAAFDGIFGYVTQAAVRLFQEYVRTIEGFTNSVPDGIIGSGTMRHITRWEKENKFSEWGSSTSATPSETYTNWIQLLHRAKQHYIKNPGPILEHLNNMKQTYSTLKPLNWTSSATDIHLIGIRRKQDLSAVKRENDDLFVLLINGMVFTFWGSTDASVTMARRKHEAFLIEGQHRYRFGWHKIAVENKIYKALKPLNPKGVMIIRDWDDDNAYTAKDIRVKDSNGNLKGLLVNPSINIHWTGNGRSNFSAGCQVIAGKSYLNHKNKLQDCSNFASVSYGGLTNSNKKTKGAYNVFTDLILCYASHNTTNLYYTLGREASLDLSNNFGAQYAAKTLEKLKSV